MLNQIALVNETSDVTAEQMHVMCAVLNDQICSHFCLAWGLAPVLVTPYAQVGDVPDGAGYAILRIVDMDETPDALGWHSEENARVIGIISNGAVIASGGVTLLDEKNPARLTLVSVVSHEVLETIADQFINAWADGPRIAQGSQYAWEVCDPVEGDQYVIDVANVAKAAVSNFVLPSWFDPEADGPVDYLGTAPGPFQLAPGGYMVVRDSHGHSSQVFAEHAHSRAWRRSGAVTRGPGYRSRRRCLTWPAQ